MIKKYVFIPLIFGIILFVVGLALKVPGTALTTKSYLNGKDASSYYNNGSEYSVIDEYVGGDAYNYIIGASLISGKVTGMIVTKTIVTITGVISIGLGLTLILFEDEKDKKKKKKERENEISDTSVLCTNCGFPINDNETKCKNCGNKPK